MIRATAFRCLAACLALASQVTAQTPARDLPPKQSPTGTSSLAGIVVTDDSDARPLRRVRVFLNDRDIEVARTTISDDAGRFVFAGLPAGRYTVGATKEGFVTINHGAKHPGRPGTPISLGAGKTASDITLKLPKGAVITGTLLDAEGQPAPGVHMRALRYVFTSGGERRLAVVNTGIASQTTDDRGIYRIYGLAAGEYAVAAPARLPAGGGEVLLMSDAEVRRALDEIKQAGRQQPPTGEAAGADMALPRIGYAPVFYPGTTVASQAAMIRVAQGEERGDINFQLQLVPMSTIRGFVLAGEGVFNEYITVYLIANTQGTMAGGDDDVRAARVSDGKGFSFLNVAPGQYTVMARGTRGPGRGAPVFWASTDVIMDGQSEFETTLSLQPALTVSGRIAFQGTAVSQSPTTVRVTLVPVLSGGQATLGLTPASVDAAGRFTIGGITPGRYRLQATISGVRGDKPVLKSSIVNERDTLDLPLDLRQSVDGAVVTFSDRSSELSGVVRDGAGQTPPGCFVILFPTDRAFWTPMSRRVRSVSTTAEGGFEFLNVPPGEYGVAAVADVEEGEWYDPGFLERLSSNAVKATIAEGEKKSLILRNLSAPEQSSGRLSE